MPRGQNQKLKLFYLAKIMTQETDAEHFLTKQQIFDELSKSNASLDADELHAIPAVIFYVFAECKIFKKPT